MTDTEDTPPLTTLIKRKIPFSFPPESVLTFHYDALLPFNRHPVIQPFRLSSFVLFQGDWSEEFFLS